MNVMILAAGEGTRLRPYTLTQPKPSIPFLTVPLACYSLSLFENIKIDTLVANTFYLPKQIEDLFRRLNPSVQKLCFSEERGEILGSGGGIHNAAKFLKGGDFVVMNGDEVILPAQPGLMQEMIDFHHWHKGIATLMVMEHAEVGKKFGGAWVRQGQTEGQEKVTCFSKTQPSSDLKGYHFVGVMIFSERIFSYFKDEIVEENILYETLTKAMSLGEEVYVHKANPIWFETGNPADFTAATQFCVDELSKSSSEKPYWQEYLAQTVRLWSEEKCVIEKDQQGLEQKVLSLVQKIRS